MQKIRFIFAVELQDEHRGTHKATRYEAGQQIDVSTASAAHWINRGKAELVVNKPDVDKLEAEPIKPRRGRPPKAKDDA